MKSLIVIPTPIGHMDDISKRSCEMLSKVDILLCESISNTKKLYQLLGIPCPKLMRFWQKTESAIVGGLEKLDGNLIGLVSDAGMPCISDPGFTLVSAWHERGWPVTVLPGPSALTVSVALSGLPADSFQFLGFLPPKSNACQTKLRQLKEQAMTGVLYESPNRIVRLCEDIMAVYGEDHRICVMKELTKTYESVYRGSVASVMNQLKSSTIKGEFCVVIDKAAAKPAWEKDAVTLLSYLSVSDCASVCSEIHQVSRSKVYRFLVAYESLDS